MADLDAFHFHSRLCGQRTLAACAKLFAGAIAPFGFDAFACGAVDLKDRDRHVFYVMDWPEAWLRFYVKSGLIDRDPVVDALAFRHEPFTWTDLRRDRKFKKVGREALDRASAEGWSEGLVVPISRGAERTGLVSLVGHRSEIDAEARAFLSLISICLHAHVRMLVSFQGFSVPPVGLTAREIECINLVARGLSDNALARTLGVAPSTAHEFVEKAKRRLKTRSRVEMVAVAASLGIIAF
jgi:DNA-binding CsgD family transcriptional regulator